MNYKISSFERAVGLFLLVSFVTVLAVLGSLVAKSHFFKKTYAYIIMVENVNQLQKGTKLQVKGLTIGSVSDINLEEKGIFKVMLEVEDKYHVFMKMGSAIHFKNPIIVGEKILEVVIGEGPELLEDNAILPVNEGEDIVKKIGDINWQKVNSILDKLDSTMGHTDLLMAALSKDIPKVTARTPKMASDVEKTIAEMNALIKDLTELKPFLKQATADLPQITSKTDKAIGEAILVLRAAQSTWLLKSNVKEAKKELEGEKKN